MAWWAGAKQGGQAGMKQGRWAGMKQGGLWFLGKGVLWDGKPCKFFALRSKNCGYTQPRNTSTEMSMY